MRRYLEANYVFVFTEILQSPVSLCIVSLCGFAVYRFMSIYNFLQIFDSYNV